MWQMLRLITGLLVLLLSPLVGAVVALCVVVNELNEYGLEKVGYHTISEVLGILNEGVPRLISAWRKQPKI